MSKTIFFSLPNEDGTEEVKYITFSDKQIDYILLRHVEQLVNRSL